MSTTVVASPVNGGTPSYIGRLALPAAGDWRLTAPSWNGANGNGFTITVIAASSSSCLFKLGFADIHAAIPLIVGDCADNEAYTANGDSLQHTTHGLLVWRKADNFTAFTDGYHSWVHGPHGIQERLNTERFAWEAR